VGSGIDNIDIGVAVVQAVKAIEGDVHCEVTVCTVESVSPRTAILEPGLDPRVEYITRS
jgi:hypothetical protein